MNRLALALAAACLTFTAHAADRITGKPFATRSEVLATHGMVATSVPLATQIGLDVLKKGGTRGRCGDCCECGAGVDGAGVERCRRRSVRDRLGCEDEETVRLQRVRAFTKVADPAMVHRPQL